jgi:hypothetical protein
VIEVVIVLGLIIAAFVVGYQRGARAEREYQAEKEKDREARWWDEGDRR